MPEVPKVPTPNGGKPISGQEYPNQEQEEESQLSPDYLTSEEQNKILEDFKNLLEEFRERNLSAEDAFESVLIAHGIIAERNGKKQVVSEGKYKQASSLFEKYRQTLPQERGKISTPYYFSSDYLISDYLTSEEQNKILEDFKNLLEEFRERNLSAEDAFESVLIAHGIIAERNGKKQVVSEGKYKQASSLFEKYRQEAEQKRKEIEFKPHEVFDHLLKLREKTGKDIVDVDNVTKSPDGTLIGRVLIKGKWFPFKGDTIIETIAEKEFEYVDDIHSQPDGTLVGIVDIEGERFIFKGNTIIETIAGKKIEYTYSIHSQPDGTLAGQVKIEGKRFIFKGDTLIDKIAGREFKDVRNIHSQADGTLAGQVKIEEKWLPFKGDTLIDKIAGKEFEDVDDIHSQADGTLAGQVKIEGEWFLFKGDTLIRKIAGKKIEALRDIHSQADGTLAGRVYIEGKSFPFKGDTLIRKIAGKKIEYTYSIHSQPDGTLAGRVGIKGIQYHFLWYDLDHQILFAPF
ncbi:MAG: hypothetical protein QXK26_01410 [Candidatus Bathyarchaeia archaeon]